jgi:hypothetical protein
MKKTVSLLLFAFFLASIYIFPGARVAMAIEKLHYETIDKDGSFELRRYPDHIVAETVVEGPFGEAANEGFRILAAYIFGKNRTNEKIQMTAPVSQEPRPEKIQMTAPVGQQASGPGWRITFVMPSQYHMDTLPEPIDGRVILTPVSGQLFAVLRYTGSWRKERYEKKKAQLESMIASRGLTPIGGPVLARYNPPFMPWFLRRNEVLIPVRPEQHERRGR